MKEITLSIGWGYKVLILFVGFGLFPFLITSLSSRGVKAEVVMFWWMLSVSIGMMTLMWRGGGGLVTGNIGDLIVSPKVLWVIICLGFTVGTLLNTLFGQAIGSSPNPGLAMMIVNAAGAITYLVAPLFHKMAPKLFPFAHVSIQGFAGIACVLLGLFLIIRSK